MKLAKKITTEDFYEDYINEYEEALKEFCGGQEISYWEGFEDEIYNYRQLIKFFSKNIIAEERETEKKIKDAWQDDEDIRFQYSHVKSLRTFTLHSTYVSIHSMFEGRLLECIEILNKFKHMEIPTRKKRSTSKLNDIEFLLSGIHNKIPALDISENEKERIFHLEIKNKITHYKCLLKKEDDLVNKIKEKQYLSLKSCDIGSFNYKFQIKKSMFLTEYLAVIEHDLKLIFRSIVRL